MIAQRCDRVLWRRSAARVLVLPVEAADAVVLEGLTAAIWEVLESPLPTADLAEDVSAALEMPILQAEETVAKLLDELVGLRVLTCHPTT